MPVPNVRTNEGKQDFLSRCMGDATMRQDYETGQRYAICNSQWEQHARRKKEDEQRQSEDKR